MQAQDKTQPESELEVSLENKLLMFLQSEELTWLFTWSPTELENTLSDPKRQLLSVFPTKSSMLRKETFKVHTL